MLQLCRIMKSKSRVGSTRGSFADAAHADPKSAVAVTGKGAGTHRHKQPGCTSKAFTKQKFQTVRGTDGHVRSLDSCT